MSATAETVSPVESSARTLAHMVYALQAISLLLGVTFLLGVIINYLKRSDVEGTLAESHFTWQIRTFWYGLFWSLIGIVTASLLIGYILLLFNLLWIIYRIVKGWLRLSNSRPMYA